jgi:hypothetical protein
MCARLAGGDPADRERVSGRRLAGTGEFVQDVVLQHPHARRAGGAERLRQPRARGRDEVDQLEQPATRRKVALAGTAAVGAVRFRVSRDARHVVVVVPHDPRPARARGARDVEHAAVAYAVDVDDLAPADQVGPCRRAVEAQLTDLVSARAQRVHRARATVEPVYRVFDQECDPHPSPSIPVDHAGSAERAWRLRTCFTNGAEAAGVGSWMPDAARERSRCWRHRRASRVANRRRETVPAGRRAL